MFDFDVVTDPPQRPSQPPRRPAGAPIVPPLREEAQPARIVPPAEAPPRDPAE
jgi:hypothetical protein